MNTLKAEKRSMDVKAKKLRREGSYSNKTDSMKSVSDCSDVDCQAKDCRYNEECKCHAGKISVEGGDACHSSGTECATFDCCCN